MTDVEIDRIRAELISAYPECRVVVAEDKREMIAEISQGVAVAVLERSLPHFHLNTRETYRVLRGTLLLACAGEGHVLRQGDRMVIEPGQIHHARTTSEPVWVEVESSPPWSKDDHFIV